MNGELYQLCSLVSAAKKALRDNSDFDCRQFVYENSISFDFLPPASIFGQKNFHAENASIWFERCKIRKVTDFKMLTHTYAKDRHLLGFSNSSRGTIVCFHQNGQVSNFIAKWTFNNTLKKWDIAYTEFDWKDAPDGKPEFEDNTAGFRDCLARIEAFARKIDCGGFAEFFAAGIKFLDGEEADVKTQNHFPIPFMPEKNSRLFKAAEITDVFGAMGSWNDIPNGLAAEKGVEDEYNALSDELLKNNRQALLYAVNEW